MSTPAGSYSHLYALADFKLRPQQVQAFDELDVWGLFGELSKKLISVVRVDKKGDAELTVVMLGEGDAKAAGKVLADIAGTSMPLTLLREGGRFHGVIPQGLNRELSSEQYRSVCTWRLEKITGLEKARIKPPQYPAKSWTLEVDVYSKDPQHVLARVEKTMAAFADHAGPVPAQREELSL